MVDESDRNAAWGGIKTWGRRAWGHRFHAAASCRLLVFGPRARCFPSSDFTIVMNLKHETEFVGEDTYRTVDPW